MKICVVTANLGGIDPILGMPKQTVECDYFCYFNNNLPYPLPGLSDRLKSKYLKIQMHRFLPGYDAYIWLDARIRIAGNNFVNSFIELLEDSKEAIFYKHKERTNVYSEIEYIIEQMGKGNKYLLSRYGDQQLIKEVLFYKEQGLPSDYPLVMSGVFARLNNEQVNAIYDEWWQRCIEFSCFDQTMFSLVAWEKNLLVKFLDWDEIRTPKLFEITQHIK